MIISRAEQGWFRVQWQTFMLWHESMWALPITQLVLLILSPHAAHPRCTNTFAFRVPRGAAQAQLALLGQLSHTLQSMLPATMMQATKPSAMHKSLATHLQPLPVVRPPRSTLLNLVASTSGRATSAAQSISGAWTSSSWSARSGQHLLARGRAPSPCSLTPATQAAAATSGTVDIFASIDPTVVLAVAVFGLIALAIKKVFDTPSRTYDNNVGEEYDAWTEEGVLEYYWGEHIHLGYYDDAEIKAGYLKKNFKQAKFDFVDKMLEFSGAQSPKKILDVGCGFGGTSRHLAKKFRESEITGGCAPELVTATESAV